MCSWLQLCFVGGSVEYLSVSSGVVDKSGFGASFPPVELVLELVLELGSGDCCGAIEFMSRLGVRSSRSRRLRENMVRYLSWISKFSTLCVGL